MDGRIFFLLFWVLFVLVLLIAINIFLKGFQLRRNPNNENIKKFIRFAKRLYIMPNSPVIWSSLRKTYHTVSQNENIDYNLRVELFEILKLRGVIGLYFPNDRNNHKDLEQKLDELESLMKKGKITEEEYKKSRSAALKGV